MQKEPGVRDASRASIVAAYEAIAPLAPDRLDLEKERSRREPVIVRALLAQVSALEGPGLGRLFAAGLGNLPALLAARASDIEATAGLDAKAARAVEEVVAAYRRDLGETSVAADRAKDRRHLERLLHGLRREHEAFERASEKWSDASLAEKRHRRELRRRVLLQIDVLLARLGASARVDAIGRLPEKKRIEALTEWAANESSSRGSR
jgi:hypothetical protein